MYLVIFLFLKYEINNLVDQWVLARDALFQLVCSVTEILCQIIVTVIILPVESQSFSPYISYFLIL